MEPHFVDLYSDLCIRMTESSPVWPFLRVYIYIYIYMCVCVRVSVCVCMYLGIRMTESRS